VSLSRGAGTHLIQCSLGRHPLPYQVASSSIHPFGYNRHEAKTVPLLRGVVTPSNTTSPGPIFTSVPSGILIHAAVWPQKNIGRKLGGCAPLGEGELGPPSNTMSRRLRPTSVPSDILIHICSHLTTIDVGRKLGAPSLFGEGRLGPIYHKVAWAEAYLHTK